MSVIDQTSLTEDNSIRMSFATSLTLGTLKSIFRLKFYGLLYSISNQCECLFRAPYSRGIRAGDIDCGKIFSHQMPPFW